MMTLLHILLGDMFVLYTLRFILLTLVVKLVQLARRSLMAHEVICSIPNGAVFFAHMKT